MQRSDSEMLKTVEIGSPAELRRGRSQLRRLETLTDVVYGVALWRVFMLFPRPDQPEWSWHSWREFFAAEGMTIVLIAIGVAVLIIYWLQSNTLFGLAERADGKFAMRAIMQLFFVLLFLFSIRVGTELPASAWTRGFESVAALLLGLSSSWMWSYAARNRRLLHADVTDAEARAVGKRIRAEPATALFTLPFVFTPILWEAAWFSYPAVRKFFQMQARRLLGTLPALAALLAIAAPVTAQEPAPAGLRAPPRSFALPMEFEHDFGADNGEATILRILPLWSVPLSETWRLVNLELVTLADAPGGIPGGPVNPNPTPGERTFGLSDLIHASFLTPESQGAFLWGAGLMLGIPTATADVLGSGKWAAGPALRLTWRSGSWNLGAVAGQRWSFAGDSSRPDLNALIVRGTFRLQLPGHWYLVSAPIITANWNAPSAERWLVPLGGGPGFTFHVGDHRWATSLQAYWNAIRPDGAPDWALRVQLIAAIPA